MEDTGKIPKKVFNMNIGRSLEAVADLKGYFERNGLIVDQELRNDFVVRIPMVVSTSQMSEIIDEQMSKVDVNDERWKPLTKESDAFVKLSKIHVEGEKNAWGKAETTIDASPEEVRRRAKPGEERSDEPFEHPVGATT